MTTATFRVDGMTCGHCVSAVTKELSSLDGVSGVDVDLAAGTATVTSEQALDPAVVSVAVEEAGFQLVS